MSTKRLSTNTPDLYSLSSVIPEHLRDNQLFLDFVEAYFEWMQNDVTSPGSIINKLTEVRNIDTVEEVFIQYLQREYAISIPNVSKADKRKLYKQVNDIYRSKGSTPSYEALFNLMFNEQIELYFPRVDLLKPSDGKWDNTDRRYLNNNGFLSDRKYIQDSYYYQDFSYVIKTGQTIERWRDTVKKLLHPSGFAFFGQINIFSTSSINTVKSPMIQPGSAAGKPEALPLISNLVRMPSVNTRFNKYRTVTPIIDVHANTFGGTNGWLDSIKFNYNVSIQNFAGLTIDEATYNTVSNSVPGAEIVIS